MKIKIRSKEHTMTIPVPNAMILSKITARLISKYVKTDGPALSKDQIGLIFEELKKMRKTYGKMNIVEVHSADGDIVEITL